MSARRVFTFGFVSSAIGALTATLALTAASHEITPWLSSAFGAALGSALGWIVLHRAPRRQ